jgi:hypothetical protein
MAQTIEMSRATTRVLRIAGWSLPVLFIAFNVIASQFDTGVNWGSEDVIFAVIVFGVVGGLLELAAHATTSLSYRIAAAVGTGAALLLLWVNVAVGIVGSDDHRANGDYLVVLVAAIAGAAVAFGNPQLLFRAMLGAAGAHLLIGALHLRYGFEAAVINVFFVGLWIVSALLFRRAAKERETAAQANQS